MCNLSVEDVQLAPLRSITSGKFSIRRNSAVMRLSFTLVLATAEIIGQTGAAAGEVPDTREDVSDVFTFACGPFRDSGGTERFDYRERNVSPLATQGVEMVDHFHTQPALQEMQKPKPYGTYVVDNLDFTLRHCPNHYVALSALIKWDLAGGRSYGFPQVKCYLEWAHRFAPEDATILQFGGTYFWKKGNPSLAKHWFQAALEIDPGLAEAQYNYGLMLFDLKEFDAARVHARAAYEAGYPLRGLRKKLEQAGYPLTSSGPSPAGKKP